jgi:hypothetical protein
MSAVSMAPDALDAAPAPPPAATVLYDDKAIALRAIGRDPKQPKDALWVRKRDLPSINEFEVKPQGACRADLCIPIPKDMVRGEYFCLTAFAKKIGQPVVADLDAQVWSFGDIQSLRGSFLEGRMAPDFVVPDRAAGQYPRQSSRQEVLVVTWALVRLALDLPGWQKVDEEPKKNFEVRGAGGLGGAAAAGGHDC